MTAKLSTKGQVVLPKKARMLLHLRAGAKLICHVKGRSIVLTPEQYSSARPRLITEPKSGLRITQSPPETKITSKDVRVALLDFS